MQSIKPDILPVFVSFRRDTALQQSQQKLPGRSLQICSRCGDIHHVFICQIDGGQLTRRAIFETDGEPGRC